MRRLLVGRRGVIRLGVMALVTTAMLMSAAGGPVAASMQARGASGKAVPLSFTIQGGWGTSWSFNPFNPSFFSNIYSYAYLPLAIAQPPRYAGGYTPELASSWSVSPSKVTVHLRPNARWQDGKPLTSADVVTTLLLQGTNGNSIWDNITSARAAGPHTVVLAVRSGASGRAVLDTLLGIYPDPTSQYGRFVTPGLQQDLLRYWAAYSKSGPSAASATPAGKTVTAVFSKLSKYAPKHFIGDGPFKLTKISTSAAILKRWSGFWDAKKIHVSTYDVIASASNASTYAELITHRVNLSQSGLPTLQINAWRKGQGDGWATMPNYAVFSVFFNEKHYPLNLVGVRRAIAYVVQRSKIEDLAGYNIYNTNEIPDGLTNPTTQAYLSASQRQQLNPYHYDPAKASKMLRSLGFHKRAGEWLTPKGKPFTLTFDGPSGWGDSMAQALVIGKMLTNFGIKTTVSAIAQPAYWSYQTEGRYELDWGWGQQGLNPLAGFSNALVSQNLVEKSEPGMSFGPIAKVPGLGKVNIVSTLKSESINVGPGPRMDQLTWDWARFVNSQLPYLPFGDRIQQVDYVTTQYKDWPPRSSPQWQVLGINMSGGIVIMMEKGEIRPAG